jgi:dCMP deaminase
MRPSWNDYFMDIAKNVGERSTCLRRQVGCVIVKDKRMVATGYNGAPASCLHCAKCAKEEVGLGSGQGHDICRASHAEMNAICQAAMHGTAIKGADIYINLHPCSLCAKLIINSGISNVYYEEGYPDKFAEQLLKEASINVVKIGGKKND